MMSDADLQRQITSDLKPATDAHFAAADAAKQRMQKVVNVLSDALRARNPAAIKLHLNTLDGLMGDYAGLVTKGKALTTQLGQLRPDDERGGAAKLLAALTQRLGDQQSKLEGNYAKLKEMQAMANKALGEADSAVARLNRLWADMEAFLATNVKLFDTRLAQSAALRQAADAAVAARDAADLAKIQTRSEDRKTWKPTISDINMRLDSFFAETGKELPESLRDQFTRDRIKFNKTREGLQATEKKINALHIAVKAAKVATAKALDPKKAADAMAIPKGNDARVKKALEAPALDTALDALARDLKLGVSGRELMSRLKKAKLA
jgi:hypothetical protein